MFVPLNKDDNKGNLCYKITVKLASTELQLGKTVILK